MSLLGRQANYMDHWIKHLCILYTIPVVRTVLEFNQIGLVLNLRQITFTTVLHDHSLYHKRVLYHPLHISCKDVCFLFFSSSLFVNDFSLSSLSLSFSLSSLSSSFFYFLFFSSFRSMISILSD
jgi:hypothetical protein